MTRHPAESNKHWNHASFERNSYDKSPYVLYAQPHLETLETMAAIVQGKKSFHS